MPIWMTGEAATLAAALGVSVASLHVSRQAVPLCLPLHTRRRLLFPFLPFGCCPGRTLVGACFPFDCAFLYAQHNRPKLSRYIADPPSMDSPPSSSRRRCCEQPPPAAPDWAALPHDVLAVVFLMLGTGEILRGAEFVCKSWRRVALEEPVLWHRVEMPVVRRCRRGGWRAMLRDAVERSAGQCVAFSGPCDNQSLLDLVDRAPLLKSLDLFDFVASNDVLTGAIVRLHHLEDLEVSPAHECPRGSWNLFGQVCQACPRLKRLVLGFQKLDTRYGGGLAIPVMHELRYLELFNCELTQNALAVVLDSCPQLESLHIRGTFIFTRKLDTELWVKCTEVANLTLPDYVLSDD
ncbi:hypothetical protein EJB05_08686, partial [Eragrostis curvula]